MFKFIIAYNFSTETYCDSNYEVSKDLTILSLWIIVKVTNMKLLTLFVVVVFVITTPLSCYWRDLPWRPTTSVSPAAFSVYEDRRHLHRRIAPITQQQVARPIKLRYFGVCLISGFHLSLIHI